MSIWKCPICGSPMQRSTKSIACLKGHNFDMAKSGYVNLLPVGKKHSSNPGDNAVMLRARRSFLDSGFYAPLLKRLEEVTAQYAKPNTILLDAGCGEGYYTAGVFHTLEEQGNKVQVYGVDISKYGVDSAAKKLPQGHFAVGSIYHLPIADRCCDILQTIFAPYCGQEYHRVLKKDGVMLMVIPGKEHLWGLKKAIYDTPYYNQVKDYQLEGFEMLKVTYVDEVLHLQSQEDIQNLFRMTPYYYKTGREEHARLEQLEELETQISFQILQYRVK